MTKPRYSSPDLDRLLAEAPADEAARLRDVWALADEAPNDFPDPDAVDAVWRRLEAHAHTPGDRPARPHHAARRLLRPRWIGLAAVLVAGAVGVLLWMQSVTQTAAPGQRLAVTLPDGSEVELNSGSTLRYARLFGVARTVYLDGEAFFDVAPDAARPFIVETFNARVTVLGTRFNVRAWPASMDPATTVALEEGRVALAPAARPDEAVVMASGQRHRIGPTADAQPMPNADAVRQATAWRQGDLVFKDQWLGVILEDVERRFGVELALAPRALERERFSLALRDPEGAEVVVRDLCGALGLQYRETATGYELYRAVP